MPLPKRAEKQFAECETVASGVERHHERETRARAATTRDRRAPVGFRIRSFGASTSRGCTRPHEPRGVSEYCPVLAGAFGAWHPFHNNVQKDAPPVHHAAATSACHALLESAADWHTRLSVR